MPNIHEWQGKIKGPLGGFLDTWGTLIIVFLACLGSFGLGRISVLETQRPGVGLGQAPVMEKATPIVMGGLVVAGQGSEVYYYPWCTGAQKIPPQSQRWFKSEEEAQSSGLKPAKNCLGLR